jgi:TPR repeat protein
MEKKMNETYTFEGIDTVVWNCLQGSENAQDYLSYVKTMMGYKGHQKEALILARKFWDAPETEAYFPKALATVTAIADSGNTAAMAHLGRWYRHGTGVDIDLDIAEKWYQKAADLKDGKGHNGLGRLCFKSNPTQAEAHFYKAVELGEFTGYSHLADLDRKNELQHRQNALQTGEAYEDYSYGNYLIRNAQTDEEKGSHLHWIEKAAKKGYGYAAFQMAMHHYQEDSEDDPHNETAKEWCRMACDTGELVALMWFGNRFLHTPASQEEAEAYLMSACILGEKTAQAYYGGWLVNRGKSFEEQARGVAWLRSSVAQGHASAMYNLADALRKGKGVEVDAHAAHALLEQGAALGNSECQCFLGIDYMYGDSVPVDKERAHDLFQIASLQGDLWATYLLGITYEAGDGVKQDLAKAYECFMKASAAEFSGAQFRIGRALMRGHGVAKNKPAGVKWLLKAANADHTDAMIVLGATLMSGDGVAVNYRLGANWFQKAADLGNAEAMYELATFHIEGDGVEADPDKVKHWMFKAAALGQEQAVEWVNEHYPDQPDWLQNLKKSAQELPDPEKRTSEDVTKPEDKDATE